MAEISSGIDMIRMAAEVASLTLEKHPQAFWLRVDTNRLARPQSRAALRTNTDALFEDTEAVITTIWKQLA